MAKISIYCQKFTIRSPPPVALYLKVLSIVVTLFSLMHSIYFSTSCESLFFFLFTINSDGWQNKLSTQLFFPMQFWPHVLQAQYICHSWVPFSVLWNHDQICEQASNTLHHLSRANLFTEKPVMARPCDIRRGWGQLIPKIYSGETPISCGVFIKENTGAHICYAISRRIGQASLM